MKEIGRKSFGFVGPIHDAWCCLAQHDDHTHLCGVPPTTERRSDYRLPRVAACLARTSVDVAGSKSAPP